MTDAPGYGLTAPTDGGALKDAGRQARDTSQGVVDLTPVAQDPDFLAQPAVGPFSSLARRILIFNMVGLALLVAGVLYLNRFDTGLLNQRKEAMSTHAEIIALAVADEASLSEPGLTRIDLGAANEVLRRLVPPTGARAKIFDRRGRLVADTEQYTAEQGGRIGETLLSAPTTSAPTGQGLLARISDLYDRAVDLLGSVYSPEDSPNEFPISEDEMIYLVLTGESSSSLRRQPNGERTIVVAEPIKRLEATIGVLRLSTEGGDIDQIVTEERISILQVFLVALAVSIALSTVLANTIARPIRKLAEAAERGGAQEARPINPERIRIPDMTARPDEIGYLSGALRRMTEALYDRIDANESFAADVAHEIKNPLTSLRSAVETLRYARDQDARGRLFGVIEKDVGRLDRLVTDISNASRLDAELVREETDSFDLKELLRNLVEFNQAKAADKSRSIRAILPEGPLMAEGIEGRLAQVFVNLISNAISFTPEGGEIRVIAGATDGGVVVRVEDDGPGVPDDNLGSVFERFYSERPDHEEFGNHSGLGLSISRQIVDAHGGHIWAENIRPPGAGRDTPSRGARFVVEIPR